jgi:putative pyruvate formate lyase activating enzyme
VTPPDDAILRECLESLRACVACPRECRARRLDGQLGYCRAGAGFGIGSICVHRGEEPVVSGPNGICNVFFTHCNLQCLYCQNYQISRNLRPAIEHQLQFAEVLAAIERILDGGTPHPLAASPRTEGDGGRRTREGREKPNASSHSALIRSVGFVSPSHCIPQMKALLRALEQRNPRPIFVMNTNAYDKVETLASLEGQIDVYLPDLKYMDAELASDLSHVSDYPIVATAALREMYRQKGSNLILDDAGRAVSGLIVRHLVLPGQIENSKRCLRWIAEELSPAVHLSLLAQYRPTPAVADHPDLGRRLRPDEYQQVLDELEALGFWRGWTQDLSSPDTYSPDFAQSHPFE